MFRARRVNARKPARRNGYVLILFAMLLFGIMAMAALVIDIGFARLTQRQMQTAADAAALEGLRHIDSNGKQRASDIAGWTFDDDLDISSNSMKLGAGPIVSFSNPVGDSDLHASEFMSIPSTPPYRPSGSSSLAQNPRNDIKGDMVEGDFAFGPTAGSTTEQIRAFHQEESDYSRRDFPNPDPDGTIGLELHRAFLVRMRRTGETFSNGVGTSGPTLPYLFGRGSTLNRALIGRGIAARATSIAALQPVVCIGEYVPRLNHPLFLEYTVSITDWLDHDTTDDDGNPIPDVDQFFPNESKVIGAQVNIDTPEQSTGTGYVAIFSSDANNRIIGFGLGTIETSGNGQKIVPSSNQSATANVSSVFCIPLPNLSADAADVFSERSLFKDSLLTAPVLVR